MKLAIYGHSFGITAYIRKSNNLLYYVKVQHPTTHISPGLFLATDAHHVWASWLLKVSVAL